MAERTVGAALEVSDRVAVVTADPEVSGWAKTAGATVIEEPTPGLNAAAAAGTRAAIGANRSWLVVHSDLPAITAEALASVTDRRPEGGYVLSPSFDGGTSVIGGTGHMRFAYGPASFHRHLAVVGSLPHRVVTLRRLALDLDTPGDLAFFQSWPPTAWIDQIVSKAT